MIRAYETVLRGLFVDEPPDAVKALPVEFFDPALLRAVLVPGGLCEPLESDATVAALYINRPNCRFASPNSFFDESWYCRRYPDVANTVARGDLMCGFHHFINYGLAEGRWPNSALALAAKTTGEAAMVDALNSDAYLALNAPAGEFLRAFPWYDPLQHYNAYGRRLGYRRGEIDPYVCLPMYGALIAAFDADFYRSTYMMDAGPDESAWLHYTEVGVSQCHSPNRWFDEGWYRAFYPDIREAIAAGSMPSGFYHYLAFGRDEGRQPAYDLTRALEAKLPGVTEPYLLRRLDGLKRKLGLLDPTSSQTTAAEPGSAIRVWFVFPVFNPDIAFGGYQTAFALMVELHRAGFLLGIYCMEEVRPNLDYFLWRQRSPAYRAAFESCLVFGSDDLASLPLCKGDRVVAYSVWGLTVAATLSRLSGGGKPFLMAQEYEPIFYENDTLRVLCASFYDVDHVPIINSVFLERYLRAHRVGPFARQPTRGDGFVTFDPRINRIGLHSAERIAARTERTLLVYARPEGHAGRNLFEIVILALERLCMEGAFGPEWTFTGFGALSELPDVPLGWGHVLRLVKKMDEADYLAAVGASDIGVSLMCAPHPSIMPFELATAGALVVTNVYENRSAEELRAISGNIIGCVLSLDGVIDSLREALARVNDFEARHAAAYRPTAASWSDIFTPAFIDMTFGAPASELCLKRYSVTLQSPVTIDGVTVPAGPSPR